ncbi:MAG TPA: hypothetical protein VGB53_00585 [Rubricoccaceae bacterium]
MTSVDLDAHARPASDAATLAARREALLDQMGWLEDEATALGPLLGALPPWAIEEAPLPTDLSVRDMLAALARLDRETFVGWFAPDAPADLSIRMPEPPPTDAGLDALLADVAAARRDLLVRAAALAPEAWSRAHVVDGTPTDLYGAVLRIVQHDADRLKEIAYRLHEADVTMRPPPA